MAPTTSGRSGVCCWSSPCDKFACLCPLRQRRGRQGNGGGVITENKKTRNMMLVAGLALLAVIGGVSGYLLTRAKAAFAKSLPIS